jgi:hypothetical protein
MPQALYKLLDLSFYLLLILSLFHTLLHEKVKVLAEDRNLNPTAYTRLVALGNRIKPTAVYPVDFHSLLSTLHLCYDLL